MFAKGRDYTLDDQALVGAQAAGNRRQSDPGLSRAWPRAGQIEISTTPYYHPILPLLCDSNIAAVSHPGVPLPPPFRYPEDARTQLRDGARILCSASSAWRRWACGRRKARFPMKSFDIAAEAGFRWAATDSGVLGRTLGRAIGVDAIYRPYRWEQNGRQMGVIFRDHFLSDLIGFVYSGMDAAQAADDFLQSHPRELPRHSGGRPRRAGSHHSGWRKRLGILRPERPALPARSVPA